MKKGNRKREATSEVSQKENADFQRHLKLFRGGAICYNDNGIFFKSHHAASLIADLTTVK